MDRLLGRAPNTFHDFLNRSMFSSKIRISPPPTIGFRRNGYRKWERSSPRVSSPRHKSRPSRRPRCHRSRTADAAGVPTARYSQASLAVDPKYTLPPLTASPNNSRLFSASVPTRSLLSPRSVFRGLISLEIAQTTLSR